MTITISHLCKNKNLAEALTPLLMGAAFLALADLLFMLILIAAIWVLAGPLAFILIVAAAFYALLVFTLRLRARTVMRFRFKANYYQAGNDD